MLEKVRGPTHYLYFTLETFQILFSQLYIYYNDFIKHLHNHKTELFILI